MKLIIGLGNPGDKYKNNRHNVGFKFLDFLSKDNNWQESKSANLLYKWIEINRKKTELVKPQGYMNNSGFSVKKVLAKHQNIKLEEVYIVHDDLDIPLGKFKIDHATGPKLHNGIKSIEETLKTKDFWRIRIGVDNRKKESWIDGERYVLSDFTREELAIINKVFLEILNNKFQVTNKSKILSI